MSRIKKPRNKPHRPKCQPSLPIVFSVPSAEKVELDIAPHAAIVAFTTGAGSEDMAYTLANVVNLSQIMARGQAELMECCQAGAIAIQSVIDRGVRSEKWGFTGGEYQAIKAAVVLYDELQSGLTRRQLRDVIVELRGML